MENGERPAMPMFGDDVNWSDAEDGLSKREHFAAMAMQGLLTCVADIDATIPELAADAVCAADALLEELSK